MTDITTDSKLLRLPPVESGSLASRIRGNFGQAIVLVSGLQLVIVMAVMLPRILFSYATSLDMAQFLVSGMIETPINPYTTAGRLTPPFYAAAYGPIFYVCNHVVAALFGPSMAAVKVWIGCAFVVLLMFTGRAFGYLGGTNRTERFVQVSLLTCMLSTTFLIGRIRPDVPALIWLLIATNTAIRAARKPEGLANVAVIGLAIPLCLFTKQNYVLSAYLPFLYLVLHGRWKLLVHSLIATAIGTAIVWGISSWAFSHADWFRTLLLPTHNFPMANSNAIVAARLTFQWTGTAPLVLTLGYLAVRFLRGGGFARLDDDARRTLAFLVIWFAGSFLSAVFMARAASSLPHYFLEFGVAMTALGGFLYKHADAAGRPAFRWLLALSLAGGLVGDARLLRGEYFAYRSKPYQAELVEILKTHTPPQDPVVSFSSDIPLRAGRQIQFLDDGAYVNYDNYGARLPELYGKFEECLRNKAFSALLLTMYHRNFFSEKLLEDRGYVRVATAEPFPERAAAPILYLRSDLHQAYTKAKPVGRP